MLRPDKLDPDRCMILVIDVQEKLLPLIRKHEQVTAAIRKLLQGAAVFELPVMVTEQYPKGIGPTDESIGDLLRDGGATFMTKASFSACGEPPIREALREIDRPQIILVGIEAHVCVQQTALDLLVMDHDVAVCADAIGSRGKLDYKQALARMAGAGAAVTTVESVLFELCDRCDTDRFKAMIPVIKASPPPAG
jgi:isochorismate hydrolase